MAWIESHQELARHPKVKRLMRRLDISLPTVIGHLHLLWWWAMDYAEDGSLAKYDADDIADAMMWEGDSQTLLNALCDVRFLDRQEDGTLAIHDWEEYIGRLLNKRRQDAERKRKLRERSKDIQRTSDGHPEDVQRTAQVTVPYSTVPSTKIESTDLETVVPSRKDSTKILSRSQNATRKSSTKQPTNPDVKAFLTYYHDTFLSRFGEKPVINGGKDGMIVKSLVSTYGLDKLKGLLDAFFESKDSFIAKSGYTLGIFKTQVNKLLLQKTKSECNLPDAQELFGEGVNQ